MTTMMRPGNWLPLQRLPRIQLFAELLLIILVAIYAARPYLNPDPKIILSGLEAEWMTSSAYFTSEYLSETGRVPLWQPYMGHGEPSVEHPYAFTFNPFSMGPSLIFGPELGIRYSVILHVIIAGIGGWAIGRLMGFSVPARLLLGVLMLAKGSMPGVTGLGYFQLGVNQAYLPWAVAGALAIVRYPTSRMPVALLAIMLSLLHFAGHIYYFLPAVILAIGICAIFAVGFSPTSRWEVSIDKALIKRFVLAFVLTIALSAITFIPILLNFGYVGDHPNEDPNAIYENPITVITQLFSSSTYFQGNTWSENYEIYTIPLWFGALLFVMMPPFGRIWSRPAFPYLSKRILIFMLICGFFFLLWGTGTNSLMRWAYENLPFIGQWRILNRMLTVVSLALAVIVALRFDSLWRALVLYEHSIIGRGVFRILTGIFLVAVCILAVTDQLKNYERKNILGTESLEVGNCIRWLRATYPGQLTVMSRDFYTLLVYIREGVVFTQRSMDFRPLGRTPTIFPQDLRTNYARFVVPADPGDAQYWTDRGYQIIPDSPMFGDRHCLMEHPNALPYAFAATRQFLETYIPPPDPLPSAQVLGLTANDVITLPNYTNLIDAIGLTVQPLPDEETVVVLQEVAWNGWTVTIDGNPAPLESVGQMIGVRLPAGTIPRQILFRYDPILLKIGALITILTAAGISIWLLLPLVNSRWKDRINVDKGHAEMVVPPPVPQQVITIPVPQPQPVLSTVLPFAADKIETHEQSAAVKPERSPLEITIPVIPLLVASLVALAGTIGYIIGKRR